MNDLLRSIQQGSYAVRNQLLGQPNPTIMDYLVGGIAGMPGDFATELINRPMITGQAGPTGIDLGGLVRALGSVPGVTQGIDALFAGQPASGGAQLGLAFAGGRGFAPMLDRLPFAVARNALARHRPEYAGRFMRILPRMEKRLEKMEANINRARIDYGTTRKKSHYHRMRRWEAAADNLYDSIERMKRNLFTEPTTNPISPYSVRLTEIDLEMLEQVYGR